MSGQEVAPSWDCLRGSRERSTGETFFFSSGRFIVKILSILGTGYVRTTLGRTTRRG